MKYSKVSGKIYKNRRNLGGLTQILPKVLLQKNSFEIEEEQEEEKCCDSEFEVEMDEEQRKIIELRMIDMIK